MHFGSSPTESIQELITPTTRPPPAYDFAATISTIFFLFYVICMLLVPSLHIQHLRLYKESLLQPWPLAYKQFQGLARVRLRQLATTRLGRQPGSRVSSYSRNASTTRHVNLKQQQVVVVVLLPALHHPCSGSPLLPAHHCQGAVP